MQPFDDAKPSLPVGFAPSQWGALASFDSSKPRKTKKIYGSDGNSFVAAVEFGPTIHAKAIMSGGESGDPASPHFTDQALMFTQGRFRDVLFYPADVARPCGAQLSALNGLARTGYRGSVVRRRRRPLDHSRWRCSGVI